MIVYGIKRSPLRDALRVLSTLCIAAGIVLVLAPVGWVAYTAVAVAPAQNAALAAWEKAALSPTRAPNAASGAGPSGMVLTIPRLNLRLFVPEGASPDHLRRFGLGRITWTALPDGPGLVGIAGHRTTYGAPFFRLNTLRRGDTMVVEYAGRRYRYAVTESQIVPPEAVEVLRAAADERGIALVTCTPPYSAAFRLVVRGMLRGTSAAPVTP